MPTLRELANTEENKIEAALLRKQITETQQKEEEAKLKLAKLELPVDPGDLIEHIHKKKRWVVIGFFRDFGCFRPGMVPILKDGKIGARHTNLYIMDDLNFVIVKKGFAKFDPEKRLWVENK